jgi:hypothetical protein
MQLLLALIWTRMMTYIMPFCMVRISHLVWALHRRHHVVTRQYRTRRGVGVLEWLSFPRRLFGSRRVPKLKGPESFIECLITWSMDTLHLTSGHISSPADIEVHALNHLICLPSTIIYLVNYLL